MLQAIKSSGDIFWARSDRKWPQPNAKDWKKGEKRPKKTMVQVSMVAFDDGTELSRELDGMPVPSIHANLRSGLDTTVASRLTENRGLAFQGPVKVGKFEVNGKLAQVMKTSPNPHGRSNQEVVKPWMNGNDIKFRPKGRSIVDFGTMTIVEAALFEAPFEHLKKVVLPKRLLNPNKGRRENWWRLGRSGNDLKKAKAELCRFIVTTRHSKYRIFLWTEAELLPDSALVAIANASDYLFGVLHSTVHEVWARTQGTQLRDAESGFRYTPKSCFDTFPFPWPPNQEPSEADSPLVAAIASAARYLVKLRDAWLNPPGISEADLKKRTLTNLYNERQAGRATWLADAHRTLDEAVFAAYGWPANLTTSEILARLLALNHQRAAAQAEVQSAKAPKLKRKSSGAPTTKI